MLKSFTDYCRKHRHDPVVEQYAALNRKLRGHYAYFGITKAINQRTDNYEQPDALITHVRIVRVEACNGLFYSETVPNGSVGHAPFSLLPFLTVTVESGCL